MQESFKKPSIMTRIAIGKGIGLVVGMIGALATPVFFSEIEPMTRLGILFWYPTMGAFIGVFGVMNWHPAMAMPLYWWIRAPIIGAWMNLVLVLFAYDLMLSVLNGMFGVDVSPFWFVLEGALVGGLIGYLATRFGGEGAEVLRG